MVETPALRLTQQDEADALLTRNPFALVVGMLLDQQVPMERAFLAPAELARRLGAEPDARVLAAYDQDSLVDLFATVPALHRYPRSMALRTHDLARFVVERYDGDVSALWREASSGADLQRRLAELPGFGAQKAKIFLALLAKRLGVRPEGWREAAGTYGEDGVYRSVADVVDAESIAKVREYKQAQKAAAKH